MTPTHRKQMCRDFPIALGLLIVYLVVAQLTFAQVRTCKRDIQEQIAKQGMAAVVLASEGQ